MTDMRAAKIIKPLAVIAALIVLLLGGFYGCVRLIAPMGPGEFAAAVKKSASSEELRNWAFALNPNIENGQLSNASVPKALLAVGSKNGGFGPGVDRTRSPNGQGSYVRVWWGYSFGNGYAIIIGPTNLTVLPRPDVVPWVPGIYFTDPSHEVDCVWGSSTAQ